VGPGWRIAISNFRTIVRGREKQIAWAQKKHVADDLVIQQGSRCCPVKCACKISSS